MAEHGLAAQAALICETPVQRRADLLALAPDPDRLIPALPPAELCFTVLAVGLEDASWMLAHATPDQMTACVDLDAWNRDLPDRRKLGAWLSAFADAGDETLLQAAAAVDLEAWVLHLMDRVQVELKPSGDDDWEPPAGGQTIDGVFYVIARQPTDDLEDLLALLRVLFQEDYWFYFRLLQGVIWELPTETEEWALRWRTGRLEDLGFPQASEAMAIYAYLSPAACSALPEQPLVRDLIDWPAPVWMPSFPAAAAAEYALFQAFAELPEEERRSYLLEFLSLANRAAVADDLPLGEAATLPTALTKVALFASLGLVHLMREHGEKGADLLRRMSQQRLFQIGFNLERAAGRVEGPRLPEETDEEDEPSEADASDEGAFS